MTRVLAVFSFFAHPTFGEGHGGARGCAKGDLDKFQKTVQNHVICA